MVLAEAIGADAVTDREEPKKKFTRKLLGIAEPIVLLERNYRPYDFASILESVIAIEAISDRMSVSSSYAIEDRLGLVKKREGSTGTQTTGAISKSRKGDKGLDPPLLQKLMDLDSAALPWCSALIWELIRSGDLQLGSEQRYRTFSERVCNILHVRTLVFGIQRIGDVYFRPVTLHHLRCLVTIGTLDAITALWMLLIQARDEGAGNVLVIASHIPPALALFHCRPEGRRTAILLFARMRQLILDKVQSDAFELSLCRYSLTNAASESISWTLPALEIPYQSELRSKAVAAKELSDSEQELPDQISSRNKPARRSRSRSSEISTLEESVDSDAAQPAHRTKPGLPEIPDDVVKWIECWRAPLRRVGRRSADAPKWTYPALKPERLINLFQPDGMGWGKKAIAKFKEELGDFL